MASNGSDGRDRKRKEASESFHNESTSKTSKQTLGQSPLDKGVHEFQDMPKKERHHRHPTTPRRTHERGEGGADKALKVSIDVKNGEYALKVTTLKAANATAEQAPTAAVLLSQAEAAVLRELGEKLLSHIRSRI